MRMLDYIRWASWFLFAVFVALAVAAPVNAEVVTRVVDGDTFYVGKEKFRLYGVDAFELSQPGGRGAKSFLSSLILNKDVKLIPKKAVAVIKRATKKKTTETVRVSDRDPFGRLVVSVEIAGARVADALVSAGWAVAAPEYCLEKECDYLIVLEAGAVKKHVGAWALSPAPLRPKDYRASMYKILRVEE